MAVTCTCTCYDVHPIHDDVNPSPAVPLRIVYRRSGEGWGVESCPVAQSSSSHSCLY